LIRNEKYIIPIAASSLWQATGMMRRRIKKPQTCLISAGNLPMISILKPIQLK
jgi:hypothetical protein